MNKNWYHLSGVGIVFPHGFLRTRSKIYRVVTDGTKKYLLTLDGKWFSGDDQIALSKDRSSNNPFS